MGGTYHQGMQRAVAVKILFVLEYYPPYIGGMGTLFQNLCEGLVKRGHKVSVVTMRLPNTEKEEQLNSVRIHRVRCPKFSRYWFTFLAIPAVLKMAKGADIIHTTTYNGAFPAWVASKVYRKPCVITVHEIWGKLWSEFASMKRTTASLHQFFEWLIIRLGFGCYVGVSNCTVARIKEHGQEATTVYNGIDYEFFNPHYLDRGEIRKQYGFLGRFVYLFYGRPGLSKGLEYLVSAIRLVKDKIPNSLAYLIVGDEPKDKWKQIRDLVDVLGVGDSVRWIDSVPYAILPHQIVASDCVVIPSLSEGFGFSAAEACAMGKPVVASNVTSLPEVVSGKYVLIEPRNPKAIARGIVDVYKGKFKKSKLKKFTWSECIDGYEEIYKDLLE
jgi:D-inositol-3-phosphate glycosyltransferase